MLLEETYEPGNPTYAGTGLLVVLSGCSGGGKSTLINEMARRGYPVQIEAGRQIVKEQRQIGGDGLPWMNTQKFVDLTISRAMLQFNLAAPTRHPVLFDRSLVDLLPFFERDGMSMPPDLEKAAAIYRYASRVFFLPPWEEIFRSEPERPKSFTEAVAEVGALERMYRKLGYSLVEVPKMPVDDRADFLEESLTK
ncbi:MAG: AAA family ATPase [Geminicoccaceae bacterium]